MSVSVGISAILVMITGYTVVQASAVAYGHTLPLHRTRLPRLILIARILKERRGKGSFFFMIKWGWWNTRKNKSRKYRALQMTGFKKRDIRQLEGLYRGLSEELGQFHAVASCTQIIRSLEARRKNRS